MNKRIAVCGAIFVTACTPGESAKDAVSYLSPGHEFIVRAGFGAESATLILNGIEYRMEETEPDIFTVRTVAVARIADSSSSREVRTTSCAIVEHVVTSSSARDEPERVVSAVTGQDVLATVVTGSRSATST